jgi:hypothetical protein
MARENFNRYENDKKKRQPKQDKKLRSPVSKGSRRTQDKQSLQRAIDHYEHGGEDNEEL